MERRFLTRFAWLSISAAILTLVLKLVSYQVTGSVGILSDAVESVVNLAASLFALAMLIIAARPQDEGHPFGHSKAEYFAGGVEGVLVLGAAGGIAWAAAERLMDPQPISQVGVGLVIASAAAGINWIVALTLLRAGKKFNSLTLEADAHHLLTDVWTSAGVIVGVGVVAATGWHPLDPVVAFVVAGNIVFTGYKLLRRSVAGLMDETLPKNEREAIGKVFDEYRSRGIQFHALQTRAAGNRRFVSAHVLVPGHWTVHEGHQLAEEVEEKIRALFPDVSVLTHLESLEDPASWDGSRSG